MRHSLMIAGIAAFAPFAAMADDKPVLTIYTYDSFVAEWGPGPAIETAFEADCACDLQFVAPGDAAAMLSRLMLEGSQTQADVILGLDTNLTQQAAETGLLGPHGLTDVRLDLPVEWNDATFVPFDWGYFAFVYDKTKITEGADKFRGSGRVQPAYRHPGSKVVDARPGASDVGQGRLWRPRWRDMGGAVGQYRHRDPGLVGSLWAVP